MTTHLVPARAHVATATGPEPAGSVSPGRDIVVVDRTGRVIVVEVLASRAVDAGDAVRLLTEDGDVLIESNAVVPTRTGRLFAHDVARRTRAGTPVRLEIARSSSLPLGKPPERAHALRSSLRHLPDGVVRAPASLNVKKKVADIMRDAEVPFDDLSDDRWTVVRFDLPRDAETSVPPSAHDADLLTLTAWQSTPQGLESRTAIDDSDLRARLLAGLRCAGTPGRVRWGPGYCPVEARVRAGEPRAFTVARNAIDETHELIAFDVPADGSIVVDQAITGTRGPKSNG